MSRFEVSVGTQIMERYDRFNQAIEACNKILEFDYSKDLTVFDYEAQPGMNCRWRIDLNAPFVTAIEKAPGVCQTCLGYRKQ